VEARRRGGMGIERYCFIAHSAFGILHIRFDGPFLNGILDLTLKMQNVGAPPKAG